MVAEMAFPVDPEQQRGICRPRRGAMKFPGFDTKRQNWQNWIAGG
jgi:hypothetical protein